MPLVRPVLATAVAVALAPVLVAVLAAVPAAARANAPGHPHAHAKHAVHAEHARHAKRRTHAKHAKHRTHATPAKPAKHASPGAWPAQAAPVAKAPAPTVVPAKSAPAIWTAGVPVAGSTPCGAAVAKTSTSAWQCTFVDNFDGSALDLSKWSVQTTANSGFRGGPECYVDSPSNVSVGNGTLRLSARRTAQPFTCGSGAGAFDTSYTGAMVTSYGKFSQAYGRYEFRVKFPTTTVPGVQSSLWLFPQDQAYGAWPASGELDVAEFYSAHPDRAIPYLHYLPTTTDSNVTNTSCLVAQPGGTFHTYTMTWTPTAITIAFDGKTCLVDSNWRSTVGPSPAPFDKRFLISLNQGLGVYGNDPTSATPLPATMTVDWVKVWK